MQRTLTVDGDADPALAWERYAVPARWRDWSPQISGVEYPAARLSAGTGGRVRGLGVLALPFTVDAVDEAARTWSWRVRLGPVRLRLDHGVRTHGTGCRTVLRLTGPAPVVLGYAPLARVALRGLVAAP